MIKKKFSHIKDNKANMVDISDKQFSYREAVASCKIVFKKKTYEIIKKNDLKKGEIFSTSRIAGIYAAKNTSSLIPLCHNIKINYVSIDFNFLTKNF